jgi:aromatic ring-cleaving dioxygenase
MLAGRSVIFVAAVIAPHKKILGVINVHISDCIFGGVIPLLLKLHESFAILRNPSDYYVHRHV